MFVRSPRARRYILRLRPDGVVRVTIPARGSRREALEVIERHRPWIELQWRQRIAERRAPGGLWQDGTRILFAGRVTRRSRSAPCRAAGRSRFADQDCTSRATGCIRDAVEHGCGRSPRRNSSRDSARSRRSTPRDQPGHRAQPADALGLVLAPRQHLVELAARADAAARLRLHPAPRADAPAPAEPLAPVLARGGGSARQYRDAETWLRRAVARSGRARSPTAPCLPRALSRPPRRGGPTSRPVSAASARRPYLAPWVGRVRRPRRAYPAPCLGRLGEAALPRVRVGRVRRTRRSPSARRPYLASRVGRVRRPRRAYPAPCLGRLGEAALPRARVGRVRRPRRAYPAPCLGRLGEAALPRARGGRVRRPRRAYPAPCLGRLGEAALPRARGGRVRRPRRAYPAPCLGRLGEAALPRARGGRVRRPRRAYPAPCLGRLGEAALPRAAGRAAFADRAGWPTPRPVSAASARRPYLAPG